MNIGSLALIVLFFVALYVGGARRERKLRIRAIETHSDLISAAYSEITNREFISNQQLRDWCDNYWALRKLGNLKRKHLQETKYTREIDLIRTIFSSPQNWRAERNQVFLEEEQSEWGEYFEKLEKYPLTDKQRLAILTNDNRCLTVAGAGTGKTSTVIGKVGYLTKTMWCQPDEILVLSYSKATVEELEERLGRLGVDGAQVKTFHKLGLDIIKECSGRKPGVLDHPPIEQYLERIEETPEGSKALIDYLSYYYYPEKYDVDFDSKKEANHFATYHDLEGLKTDNVTLRSEKVKSVQEVKIANWLYLNGIEYQYESRYPYGSNSYQPDFFLPNYDIYLEHFGVNRDGSTRRDINQKKYASQMAWKRDLHEQHETTLVETYSYQFREQTIFNELKRNLTQLGVELKPIPLNEVKQLQTVIEKRKRLAKLIKTFLGHYKSDPDNAKTNLELYRGGEFVRESRFLAIFDRVLSLYNEDLKKRGLVDFDDMIREAEHFTSSGKYKNSFRAIIVDEYQDISRARARLLEAFHTSRPDTRLLCVGDDWQSIYRFSGSEVGLMTGYEQKYPETVRIDLDRSFRFNDRLLKASSNFVTQNPKQLKKEITAGKTADGPVIQITSRSVSAVLSDLAELNENDESNFDAFVLGRFTFTDGVKESYDGYRRSGVGVSGSTVHKSKGLEADYVVVSNVISDKYGFPSGVENDPIISLLLPESEEFPHSEERRLFYVALTRAREKVWLIVPEDKCPSPFVEELIKDEIYKEFVKVEKLAIDFEATCPVCTSLMIARFNRKTRQKFLACSHYPRCKGSWPGCPECDEGTSRREENRVICSNSDCETAARSCPVCDTGVLVERQGPHSKFIGCSAYTYSGCRYTEPVH